MSTTTEPTSHHAPHHPPESEHDKLGPLGAKAHVLHDAAELRALLVREFEAAAHAARAAVGHVDHDAKGAVHDARKALRRARAVLELVAASLPKSERRAVKRALQEARRSLSVVRDHAVAPETIEQLPLGEEDRATANRVVANARDAMPPTHEIKQLLGEAAARAAAQVEALQAALPQELHWHGVVDGLAAVYGEARQARRSAKRSKSWFHAWRRRSKELVYQLGLVSEHAGARVCAIRDEIDGVTDQLSPAVDLIMVRDFVATYAQGVDADAIDHLRMAVDAQLGDLMKSERKVGRDAFAAGRKKFGKRLARAVKRDLTPPDDLNGTEHEASA
jgi:CHAD domain-containing protein